MLTGSLPPVSRRETYLETLELTDDAPPHDPLDWGGVTAATAMICNAASECPRLVATLGAGVALPADGIITWRFEPEQLGTLEAAAYRLLVRATASDGQTIEIVDALLPLT